jgi:hypothetical protein
VRSPLKLKPLRLPGQSVEEAIDRSLWDGFAPYLAFAIAFTLIAILEWLAVVTHAPRLPWLHTMLAAIAVLVAACRFFLVRESVRRLQLGRDGERMVGQYLERLRVDGADVFHDVPGQDFNLDHVILSTRGFYAIETKTWRKPPGDARISFTEHGILAAGRPPHRDPIAQTEAAAKWLAQLLEESTGKRFPVKGVVLFPGWFVEPMSKPWRASRHKPWVLEPKALPKFLEMQAAHVAASDLKLAAYHLSQHVRSHASF